MDNSFTPSGIRVHYKDIYFRSITEARWAIAFDCLGIEWLYEPQFLSLRGGEGYQPDFRVHFGKNWEYRIFFEVKGLVSQRDINTTVLAALALHGAPIVLLTPVPEGNMRVYHRIFWFEMDETGYNQKVCGSWISFEKILRMIHGKPFNIIPPDFEAAPYELGGLRRNHSLVQLPSKLLVCERDSKKHKMNENIHEAFQIASKAKAEAHRESE